MAQDGGQRDHAGFGEHGVEAVAPGYGDPHDVPPDAEAMAPLSDEHAHHAHMHVPDSLADAAKDLQEDAAKKVRGGVAHCLACVPCVRACARAALCGLRPSPPPRAAALCDRAVHLASRAHGVCKPAGGQAGQACDGGPAAARAGPAEGTAQALQVGARACRAVQARQNASPVPRVRAVRARQAAPGVPRLQRGFAALVPAQQAQARLQSVQRVPAQPGEAVLQGLQRLRRVCARPAAQKLPRVLPSVAQRKVPTRPLTQPLQRVPRTHGRP